MARKRKNYGISKSDMNAMRTYLKLYGVPERMINEIRMAFANDAIREADDMKYDRIYAALALALHRGLGLEAEKIVEVMHEFDNLSGYIGTNSDDFGWDDAMKELFDEVGIVVRTDEENRIIFEYDLEEEGE